MATTNNQDSGKLAQAKEILKAQGWTTVDYASMSYEEILKAAGVKK